MFQKGPGEGYMAAKADVKKHWPNAVCKFKQALSINGYVIYKTKEDYEKDLGIASGKTARDAWNQALYTTKETNERNPSKENRIIGKVVSKPPRTQSYLRRSS